MVYLVLTQISNIRYQTINNNSKYSSQGKNPVFYGDYRINLILALFFVVHPLSVQAVAWIPGRNDSLLALFILLTFYFFLAGSRYFILHLFFLLCALFTKETTLVFPVVLGFYHFIYRARMRPAQGVPVWQYYFGWISCVIIFLLAKHSVVGSLAFGMSVKDIFCSVIKNCPGALLYVGKVFLPVNLSVLPILRDSNLVIGGIVAVIISGIFWVTLAYGSKSGGKLPKPDFAIMVFGLLWFLVFLFPTFVYPDLKNFLGFLEHRAYLPMVGILIFLQEVLATLSLPGKKYKNVFMFLAVVIILLFALITILHSFNFRDRLTFWKKAVSSSPHSSLAHKNLGAMLFIDENLTAAEKEFRKALELNPEETIVHNNLGLILMNAGRFKEAEKEYEEELRCNPAYDDVYFNFGLLRYKEGRLEEAEMLWKKTVELNPGYIDAWQCLIQLAAERNDRGKMQRYLIEARNIGLRL